MDFALQLHALITKPMSLPEISLNDVKVAALNL